ncbi:hypothetical protein [Janthinobacterium sp. B9-8]|uniref:hypothetical protein n=1 Tax=Janthinobacterium sp. B9-8 TaxID=1236179 RepID=UPI00061D2E39|nr:hypothetical protein [Janthinobacterium sp. B9-8]AMC35305.1 hypothetical protein VN23_12145 [Janthinobacterium sp. B9-8]
MEFCESNMDGVNELQEQQEVKEMLDRLAKDDPVLKSALVDDKKTWEAIVKTGQLGLVDIIIRSQYIILAFTLLNHDEVQEMDIAIKDKKDAYGRAIPVDIAFKDYMGLKFWQNEGKTYSEIKPR